MKMHKYLWMVIISLALLATGFAKDKVVVESKWAATPLQIDGNLSDWVKGDTVMNKDYNLSYAFKNDDNFLYVLLVFDLKEVGKGKFENKYMSSIDYTGLTLWLNAEGKEKKTHGLRFYRKQVSGDRLIQEMEKQGQTLTDEQKQKIKSKPSYPLFACDVLNNKGRAVPHPGAANGTFRTARIEKGIIFEYVVPVALLQDPASQNKWDPALPLKVGFEWGGMTEEMKKNYAGRVGDQGARADASGTSLERQLQSGYEGGDSFRDSQSSLADSLRGIPKKYDFWIDLKFAAKQ